MTMKEKNLPKFYLCGSWEDFFKEMENCLQNGIVINENNYLEYLSEFERSHKSWINSFND